MGPMLLVASPRSLSSQLTTHRHNNLRLGNQQAVSGQSAEVWQSRKPVAIVLLPREAVM
jgi:hypothetical protein